MARTIVEIKGLDSFKKGLTDLQLNQYPFAMKEALNEMSGIVQKGEKQQMTVDFDRPTPFTLNALKINYATKAKLSGGVVFKDPTRLSESQHYLYPNVYGVKRGFKKFEAALYAKGIIPANHYAIPGKTTQLDAYGNVSSALINQVLSYFQAFPEKGYAANTTTIKKDRLKKGNKSTFGYDFFSLRKKQGRLLPGIYRKVYLWDDTTEIYPVFIFVPKSSVGYQRVFKFHPTGRAIFENNFRQIFNEKMALAMKTAFK